jgi:glutamate--cysteine ligase
LVYLFGASPYKDESYKCRLMAKDADHAISLRSSRCGYSNPAKLPITYNSYRQHLADLQFSVDNVHSPYTDLGVEDHGLRVQLNDHILQLGNEYYFSVRLKPPKPYDDLVEALTRDGVQYIEVRIFDVNPFEYSGVSVRQLYFAHLFLLFCLLTPSAPVDEEVLNVATVNQQDVALYGRSSSLYLQRDAKNVSMTTWAKEILASLKPFADAMDKVFSKRVYGLVLEYFMKSVDDPKNLPAFRMANDMKKKHMDYIPYGMQLAQKYSLHKF